jgi:hypothetical protein
MQPGSISPRRRAPIAPADAGRAQSTLASEVRSARTLRAGLSTFRLAHAPIPAQRWIPCARWLSYDRRPHPGCPQSHGCDVAAPCCSHRELQKRLSVWLSQVHGGWAHFMAVSFGCPSPMPVLKGWRSHRFGASAIPPGALGHWQRSVRMDGARVSLRRQAVGGSLRWQSRRKREYARAFHRLKGRDRDRLCGIRHDDGSLGRSFVGPRRSQCLVPQVVERGGPRRGCPRDLRKIGPLPGASDLTRIVPLWSDQGAYRRVSAGHPTSIRQPRTPPAQRIWHSKATG